MILSDIFLVNFPMLQTKRACLIFSERLLRERKHTYYESVTHAVGSIILI